MEFNIRKMLDEGMSVGELQALFNGEVKLYQEQKAAEKEKKFQAATEAYYNFIFSLADVLGITITKEDSEEILERLKKELNTLVKLKNSFCGDAKKPETDEEKLARWLKTL